MEIVQKEKAANAASCAGTIHEDGRGISLGIGSARALP